MTSIVDQLRRWWALRGFWSERADFYRAVSRSLDRKELLRDFVEGELRIALEPMTADKDRAAGLAYIRETMEQGSFTLADVLQAAMPDKDRMALGTLRHSRTPIDTLKHLAEAIDQQKELSKVLFNALFSPLVLVPIGFAFAYTLATVSFPLFVKSAPPEIWTGFNLVLKAISEGFATFGPYVFAALAIAMLWLFVWALPNLTSAWRFTAERAMGWQRVVWTLIFPAQPALRMYRDIAGTRMLTDLAYILQSGALLNEALETMAQDAQPWMQQHIVKILTHLRDFPGDYVGAFSHGVLSPFLLGRVHSQVRTDTRAQFDKVLIEVGARGQRDAREAIRKTSTKLNTILLALTLGTILFFYVGQGVVIKSIEDANSPAAVMKREAAKRNQQL
jgi:hypothetical protein